MDPQLPTTQALPDDSSLFIQSVSWISLLIAGLIVLPVALLLVLDVIVWLWRTYWAHGSPTQDQSECSSAHSTSINEGQSGHHVPSFASGKRAQRRGSERTTAQDRLQA